MGYESVTEVRRPTPAPSVHPPSEVPTSQSGPLSYAQERVFFVDQLAVGLPVYNVAMRLDIEGILDSDVFLACLAELVQRHQALRTNYIISNSGQIVQTANPNHALQVPFFEVADVDMAGLETEICGTKFNLARDLLIRAALVRRSPVLHSLLLTIHHIVVDRRSMKILFHELFEIYSAKLESRAPRLVDLPSIDFAQLQREWLNGAAREKQLAFWKQSLGPELEYLPLATDFPRPPRQTFRGARESAVIPENLLNALEKIAHQERASLFMVLLAAFQSLVHRYSGRDQIALGYPIANRGRFKIENLVGFFVNTLLVSTDFSGNPSFRDLLRQVRNAVLDGHENQDVPFEQIIETVRASRPTGKVPPFQSMFVLQEDPLRGIAVPGLEFRWCELGTGTSKLDLLITIEKSNQLEITAEYNPDLFEAQTIRGLLEHYRNLLDSVVENTESPIGDLAILSEAEHRQLVVDFNDTWRPIPDTCVHELFETRTSARPEAVALISDARTQTYRELNNDANHIASELLRLGVAPDARIGICADRSPEVIAGVLGILKAGGAYVPLDPAYPRERLDFMVHDAALPVIVTPKKYLKQMQELGPRVLCLEDFSAQEPIANVRGHATPDSLAYVLYTSGSTGTPKGVEVPHRAIVRLLFGKQFVSMDESRTFLHLAPLSFDASTFEIWGALLHGARCVLYPASIPTVSGIENELRKHQVTTLWLTSSLFNCVIDENPQALSSIQQLLVGGEALSVSHIRRALESLPNTQLFNGYGPTESTTFTCTYPIPKDFSPNAPSIPIGKPISNTQVFVLDRYKNPVPLGVPGELHIAGDGLAHGYLNRPELTSETFVAHPFTHASRAYRTGDLVRYRRDGNLEFLGRLDSQVKVNGFRIELGEIETALLSCPLVKAAAVVLHDQPPLGKRIIAYVAGSDDGPQVAGEIRAFLARKLPAFSLPAQIVFLEALPATASGKLDRQRLSRPGASLHASPFTPPSTAKEAKLLEIWQELLGTTEIGIDQDFFDLGGNSILVARLLVRIEKFFGRKLDVATIFEAPTIRAQAAMVRPTGANPRARRVFSIQPVGARPPFFCVGAGPYIRPLSRLLGPDQPFLGLGLSHEDEKWLQPNQALEQIAAPLVASLRECQAEGPYLIGGWCHDGVLAYEIARQLLQQGQTVSLLALFDCQNPTWQNGHSIGDRIKIFAAKTRHVIGTFAGGLQNAIPALRSRLSNTLVRMRRSRRVSKGIQPDAHPGNARIGDILFNAVNHYDPGIYPGEITVFQCKQRPSKVYWNMSESWRAVAQGGVRTFEIPGDHRSMFSEPNTSVLARHLEDCMKD